MIWFRFAVCQAHDYVKAYFDERKGSIANLKPGRFHSITCISHYEMYAAVRPCRMLHAASGAGEKRRVSVCLSRD
jgi:hypothetical protein